mmetsp:Transcript_79920/g.226045  ORF Transcript_79920/g.226045 Transcript_79920/m.226045 type:complete len:628 (-) Transcript_79920:365-2248(-)
MFSSVHLVFAFSWRVAETSLVSGPQCGGAVCRNWSLLQVRSSVTSRDAVGTADAEDVTDQACRGATATDNSDSYYDLFTGIGSLAACQDICVGASACKGIEYNAQADAGRCEVWTRPEGIGAVVPASGFACLRYQHEFVPVDTAVDGACRGADQNDDSEAYYTLHAATESLAVCKQLCASTPGCKGIEYSTVISGRCEVWTRPQGIGGVEAKDGFTCLRFQDIFRPIEPAPPATTASTTTDGAATTITATTTLGVRYSISAGAEFVFRSGATSSIYVVGLTSTTAVVCSTAHMEASCRVARLSDTALSGAEAVPVGGDAGQVTRFTLARLSETAVMVCWTRTAGGTLFYSLRMSPRCDVLHASGTNLTKGESLALDVGGQVVLSVSARGLSPTAALVCYDRLADEGILGFCTAVAVSGGQLAQGNTVQIAEGDLEYGPEIMAARLSESRAIICYRDIDSSERAACSVLDLLSLTLSLGPALHLTDGHFHSLSAAGLSVSRALVCFKDFATRPPHSACAALELRDGALMQLSRVELAPGRPSVARLSDSLALVCSCDEHHTRETWCNALSLTSAQVLKGPGSRLPSVGAGRHVVAGFAPQDALVCYEERKEEGKSGACAPLALLATAR